MAEFSLREVAADDGAALVALAAASADTGAVRVAANYLRDPVEAWSVLRPDQLWVVAEVGAELIGAAQVSFGEVEVEGQLYRCARLSGLMVHSAHRRQGVASALTEWRLDRAGPEAVVVAGIQKGNEGSFANAQTWATQVLGKITIPVFRAGPRALPPRSGALALREPTTDAEWDQAAVGLAAFEDGWNLRVPETGASLSERAARAPFGERVQQYVSAIEAGEIVGGMELFDSARLQTVSVERVPPALRALNVLLRVLPADRELCQLSVSRLWYANGREDAGTALWEYARSAGADNINAVTTQFDARGPLRRLVSVRPWTPKGAVAIAVRSPVRLEEAHLLAPP